MKVAEVKPLEMTKVSLEIPAVADKVPPESREQKDKSEKEGKYTGILGTAMSPEMVKQAVEVMNQAMEIFNYNLQFKIHQATNQVVVKVVDKDSGEVIREIPPEQMLDMMARMRDAVGVLLDKIV